MTNFNFLTGGGSSEKTAKKVLTAVIVWLLALLVFLAGSAQLHRNRALLEETDTVLNAATIVKAYIMPDNVPQSADTGISSLTDIISAASLSDRIAQLDSNGGETLVRADRVYPDELEKLVSMLSARGMQITAAEIRAANVNGERLLFLKLSVRGAGR